MVDIGLILSVMPVGKPMGYREIRDLISSRATISQIAMAINNNATRFSFEEQKHKFGTRKLVTRKF